MDDDYFKNKKEDKLDIRLFYAESEAEESFTPYVQYTEEELRLMKCDSFISDIDEVSTPEDLDFDRENFIKTDDYDDLPF